MFVEYIRNGKPIVINTNEIICIGPAEEDNCSYIKMTTADVITIDRSYETMRIITLD